MYLFFYVQTATQPANPAASFKELENWPRITWLEWKRCNAAGTAYKSFSSPVKLQATDPGPGRLLSSVLNTLLQELDTCQYLVAHNMDLQKPILAAELHRISLMPTNRPKSICTMKAIAEIIRQNPPPILPNLYDQLLKKPFPETYIEGLTSLFFELKKNKVIVLP